MTLPTANTPGYGSSPAQYGPDVTCDCMIAWLPVFSRLCELKGYGTPVVWQLVGSNPASFGTHAGGGVVDFAGVGDGRAMLAREMGAWACWPRPWTNDHHTHAVLAYCRHVSPAAAQQLRDVRNGLDGLASHGRDPLHPPHTYRTWSQGIAWAKAEIYRIEDAMYTDADRARDAETNRTIKALMSQEANRYPYYAGKFNQILADMAADDATPVTIAPEDVAAVAEALAQKVVDLLPKAPGA